jgi:hypothetical protein
MKHTNSPDYDVTTDAEPPSEICYHTLNIYTKGVVPQVGIEGDRIPLDFALNCMLYTRTGLVSYQRIVCRLEKNKLFELQPWARQGCCGCYVVS